MFNTQVFNVVFTVFCIYYDRSIEIGLLDLDE